MKSIFNLFLVAFFAIVCFSSCNSDYDVTVSGSVIEITVPARTVGLSGINQVNYGGVNLGEVDKEVHGLFCGILSGWGFMMGSNVYQVDLYYSNTDKYGNEKRGLVGRIGQVYKSEVKKYDSGYFHSISEMIYQASDRYPNYYNEDMPFPIPYHQYSALYALLVFIVMLLFFKD